MMPILSEPCTENIKTVSLGQVSYFYNGQEASISIEYTHYSQWNNADMTVKGLKCWSAPLLYTITNDKYTAM